MCEGKGNKRSTGGPQYKTRELRACGASVGKWGLRRPDRHSAPGGSSEMPGGTEREGTRGDRTD